MPLVQPEFEARGPDTTRSGQHSEADLRYSGQRIGTGENHLPHCRAVDPNPVGFLQLDGNFVPPRRHVRFRDSDLQAVGGRTDQGQGKSCDFRRHCPG